MQFCLLFLSADSALPAEPLLQTALMNAFIQTLSVEGRNSILTDIPELCCQWRGVTCRGATIVGIEYARLTPGNFNLAVLPPSIESLLIEKCEQKYKLMPRSLPRELLSLNLNNNRIHGRLYLQRFPQKVQHVYLVNNRLTGPISLVRLPRSLITLRIQVNRIKQHTVWYDELPPNIDQLFLTSFFRKNSFKRVRPIDPSFAVKNVTIFQIRNYQIE